MRDVSKQYESLAAKGRYGDTMLAHINTQEAAILKSLGGAGTINPQTGLREFPPSANIDAAAAANLIGRDYVAPKQKPSLGQAVDPSLLTLPMKLESYVTAPTLPIGKSSFYIPSQIVIDPKYNQFAKKMTYSGKSGQAPELLGFEIPVAGAKFQGIDVVGIYDAAGNFLKYTTDPQKALVLNNGLYGTPEIDAGGRLTDLQQYTPDGGGGGFGDFVSGFISDFGPMIAAGLGANFLAGSGLFAGAGGAGAAAGATAADIAASNALASANLAGYAGTELAATAAGAGLFGGATAADIAASNALAAANTAGYAGTELASISAADVAASNALAAANTAGYAGTELASIPATGVTAGGGAITGGSVPTGGVADTGMLSGAPVTPPPAVGAAPAAGAGVDSSVLDTISKATGIPVDLLKTFAPSVIQGLLSAGGSYLQSEQAKEAAKIQADAQIQAAKIAADAARFRPVGVTTRFGSSNFTTDAAGNVTGAGYTPSTEITGYQDRLRTLAGQGMTDIEAARAAYQPLTGAAQNLFTLGQGYLAKTPEQAAQDYITKQQALLAPSQQNRLAEVQNKLFQQGRTGAATSQGGNLMNTNPELAAYYNSLAQQDLVLAANADQEARNRITYGAGLFDTGANLQGRYYTGQTAAYAPFSTAMDTSSALESLAERPLTLGTEIGGRTTAGAAAGGRFLSEGISNAARIMAPANAYSGTGDALSGAAESPVLRNAINSALGIPKEQTTYTDADRFKILKSIFGT